MSKTLVFSLDLYELPLNEILQNHRTFYGLRRERGEPVNQWLKRIQNCIGRCEFSATITEFLLIDQFLCGLNTSELNSIQSVSQSWTLKQLVEHILSENIDHNGHMETDSTADNHINQNPNIALDAVKTEPVCLAFRIYLQFNEASMYSALSIVLLTRLKMNACKMIH